MANEMSDGKTCCIDGCNKRRKARGMCNTHYEKWRRNGDPLVTRFAEAHGSAHIAGYRTFWRAGQNILEHRIITEKALGKPLPANAEIHHFDGDRANNSNKNLVICKDKAYHKLLHRRQRALEESGDPNAIKCRYCKCYDSKERMRIYGKHERGCHIECQRQYQRQLKSITKEVRS